MVICYFKGVLTALQWFLIFSSNLIADWTKFNFKVYKLCYYYCYMINVSIIAETCLLTVLFNNSRVTRRWLGWIIMSHKLKMTQPLDQCSWFRDERKTGVWFNVNILSDIFWRQKMNVFSDYFYKKYWWHLLNMQMKNISWWWDTKKQQHNLVTVTLYANSKFQVTVLVLIGYWHKKKTKVQFGTKG